MKNEFFEQVNVKESTLPERAAEQISRLIADRHLAAGDKLPSEFDLAELLHVGRGTIREGVKLLTARNVLEIRRGRGTFIAANPGETSDPLGFQFYPDQFLLALDLMEVRAQIEPWTARMAALRAEQDDLDALCLACAAVEQDILAERDHARNDVLFHTAIANCAHNLVAPRLIPIVTYAIPLVVSKTKANLRMETLVDHREIVTAICGKDAERAEKSMALHIEFNRNMLRKAFDEINPAPSNYSPRDSGKNG